MLNSTSHMTHCFDTESNHDAKDILYSFPAQVASFSYHRKPFLLQTTLTATSKANTRNREREQPRKALDSRQALKANLHEALHATQRDPAIDELHEVPRQHGDWKPQQVEQRQCWEGHSRSERMALCCVDSKG